MDSASFQDHDSIPKEIARDFRIIFEMYLPGWSINGEFRCSAGHSGPLSASPPKSPGRGFIAVTTWSSGWTAIDGVA